MANEIVVKQSLKDILGDPKYKARIEELLKERADVFILSLLSLVNGNPTLAECEPISLLNAALTAAGLNLPLNPALGYAYPVPYNDKHTGTKKAQFQMGYKGFIQLCQRSKMLKTINITDVKDIEIGEKNRMSGEIEFKWVQDDKEREKYKTVGYMAFFRLRNGFEKTLYMSNEDLTKHGLRFSQVYKMGKGLWKDDFDSMARKTVIKLLLSKYAPLSVDLEKAVLADQAIIEGDGEYKYIDNEKESATDVAKDKERTRIENHIESAKTIEELEMVKDFLVGDDLNNRYYMKQEELKEKKKGNE
jgi:recombination protein RecT